MQTSTSTRQLVLPLDTPERLDADAALALTGGKGASLIRLTAAALPVPPGFILITEAYRRFLAENALESAILAASSSLSEADPASWERAASAIQIRFAAASVPAEAAREVLAAYAELAASGPGDAAGASPSELAVAVRSSATAEDLPGASFAGQQETFLNVRGEAALLDAIRRCWASLWTARALAYRHRLGIDHATVAMAVVVQQMVPADVAGVLFTANPATGERSEILVNASFGLGEAVVSGQVTPDTYLLDKATLTLRSTTLGSKALTIVPAGRSNGSDGQGTVEQAVPEDQRNQPALAEPILRQLAELGLQVERQFGGVPQDVEWAVADGRCWLLQARPITGLPPAPLRDVRWEPPIPGSRWIRRQVVEHMPEPLSPLFEDLYLNDGLVRSAENVIEQLYVGGTMFDRLVQRPLFTTVNGFAYQRADVKLDWLTVPVLVAAIGRAIPALFRIGVPLWRDRELPLYLKTVQQWKALDPASLSDDRLLEGVRELARADARYWFAVALAIGTAKVTDSLLDTFLSRAAPDRHLTSGRFLQALTARGLDSEVALEHVADLVRGSAELRRLVAGTSPDRLREALAATPDGEPVLEALDAYFEQFGHLIYSLDFAVPTQVDDPLPVLVTLRALVERPPRDADARLADLARQRDALTRETWRSFGPINRRLFRLLLGWARRFAPYREAALFYVGGAWPTLRRLALELGRRLTEAGLLEQPDDVFYLNAPELDEAITARAATTPSTARTDLASLARQRRDLREARKRLVPPPAVPADYRFKVGPLDLSSRESVRRNTDDGTTLSGFAVSPGRVTAKASVILSPADFGQMQPGTVLVCPTTTPAWTPLFSQARALVTDIGGILAHGSIVAREYGIPAVMGTGIATQRIVRGQTITVDGDTGTVTLGSTE
jgi:pyruvate,water dikinase